MYSFVILVLVKSKYPHTNMASYVDSLWKCYEKWLRLMTLIDHAGKKICHDLLFITERLPEDGKLLYKILKDNEFYIKPNREQGLFLYPDNHCTDKSKFDITLYTRIIQGLYGNKYVYYLNNLRKLRNKLFHTGSTNLTQADFETLWRDASNTLESYNFDMNSVAGLKDCEFSLPHEYGKPLLHCIERLLQGNVESFACFSYIFCVSGYLFLSNLNGIDFLVRVKKKYIFLKGTADLRPKSQVCF